jgi:hypothetical protein
MLNHFKFCFLLAIVPALVVLTAPNFSFAAPGMPEIIAGKTTITSDGKTYYAGMTGNYAIYNRDPNSTYGFDNSTTGLFPTGGANCIDSLAVSPVCFLMVKGNPGSYTNVSGRMMISRTYASLPGGDDVSIYELPALFLGGINVFGDVYKGSGTALDSLKLWGSNLSEGTGTGTTDGASWNLKSYTFNPDAQTTWTSDDFKKNSEKIETLASEATVVRAADFSGPTGAIKNLYLQNPSLTVAGTSEATKYPEGKTWVVDGGLSVGPNITYRYYGIGTIIVKGNFIAKSGVDFVPNNPNTDRLGIIVLDN